MTAPIIVILGPTASGKTDVAHRLALELGAEIVSADSMAIYRGLDAGTAKPSSIQRAEVPYHLIDTCEPTETWSAARWVAEAEATFAGIASRGRRVVVAGGTPLYLKALLWGIFEGPQADWGFRESFRSEAARSGPEAMHERLAAIDPAAAARIHVHDLKRTERALEVHHLTGRPLSEQQREWQAARPAREAQVFGLRRSREDLHERIARRTPAMFEAGLVEEVRRLLHEGFGRGASQALGYRELVRHLAGDYDLAECQRLVERNTRRLARRQTTFFNSFGEAVRWIDMTPIASAEETAERIRGTIEPGA